MSSTTIEHEPLRGSEAVLWTIERDPVLRSTIIVVALLAGPPDLDRLRARVASAQEVFPRLRQRIVASHAGPQWEDVGLLELDHHFRVVRLPEPGTIRDLLDLCGPLAGTAFDPARPLWEILVVEGIEGGRAGLVMKVHHAVTDGVGGVGLLPVFTDRGPEADTTAVAARCPVAASAARPSPAASVGRALGAMVSDPVASVAATPKVARSIAKILAPAKQPFSPISKDRGLDRHLDVIDVELRELGAAGHAVGGTLNDAFLAAVVGGLGRYHAHHGVGVEALRVTMPISTRAEGDGPGGNRFSPARFTVPASIADPAERMKALGDIARAWRHEPAVGLTSVLAGVLSRLPGVVTTSLFGSMLKGVDFVATNVPGTRERRWLAGAEVERLYGFAPPSGSAVSFTLLSHGDTCCIGINADTRAIPDPDVLATCIAEGFDEVLGTGRHPELISARKAAEGRREKAAASPPAATSGPRRARRRPPARLSALDVSFLETESPTTPMHVGALVLLSGGGLLDSRGRLRILKIRTELASRLDRCPRLRQRPMPVPFGLGRPVWVDDPAFDIAKHVHSLRLPIPGTRGQLSELTAELQMQVLDRSRPLWEMWFVNGLADGSVAVIYKVHHTVVDGVSAAETFAALLAPDGPERESQAPSRAVSRIDLVASAAVDAASTAIGFARGAFGLAFHPVASMTPLIGLGQLLGRRAPASALNRPVGRRRVLEQVVVKVDEVKAIAHRYDATVNDVVLSAVAGGLGALLHRRGLAEDHIEALMPVSLREPGDVDAGNRVTALVVDLPLAQADPAARLRGVASETRRAKAGPGGPGLGWLLRFADALPAPALAVFRPMIANQPFVNLVVTNVRGPQEPLSFLGAEITRIVPIVPLGANLPLGVAVLSYRGELVIGVHADAEAWPDIGTFTAGIEAELAALGRLIPAA